MAYSPVASVLFSVRNANKTTSGDIGRLPVTVGQACSVVKAVDQYGGSAAQPLRKVLNILSTDKVASKLGKAAKFASEHVNPLIVVSSGIKVVMADKDDRANMIIAEAGCLAGMFAGEGWMKKNLTKYLEQIPMNKKWLPFLKGIVFVTGSISCSLLGEKIGKEVAKLINFKPKTEQKSQAQDVSAYNPLNYRA